MNSEPIFFSKETIMTDLNGHAVGLQDMIPDSTVSVYESLLAGGHSRLGFTVKLNGKTYHVYMIYEINDRGEYGVHDKTWEIEDIADNAFIYDVKSLRGVIDFFAKPKTWRDIEGEWNHEQDLNEYTANGLHIIVLRSEHLGTLNGYVGVNIFNPLYGLNCEHPKLNRVHAHGGLTYSGIGRNMWNPVFKDNYWYFGFDTNHAWDLVPQLSATKIQIPELKGADGILTKMMSMNTYKNFDYVSDEVDRLAERIKIVSKVGSNHRVNHKRVYRKLRQNKKQWDA